MIKIVTGITNKTLNLITRQKIAEYADKLQFYIKASSLDKINTDTDICCLMLDEYLEYQNVLPDKVKILLIVDENDEILFDTIHQMYFINKNKMDVQFILAIERLVKEVKKDGIIVEIPNKGEKRISLEHLNYIDIAYRNLGYHMDNNETILGRTIRKSFATKTQKYNQQHEELLLLKPSFMINLTNVDEVYPTHIVFRSGEELYLPKIACLTVKENWKHFYSEDY